MRKILLLFGAIIITFNAHAHVRWFVDADNVDPFSYQNDLISMIIIAGGIAFCIVCFSIEKLTPIGKKLQYEYFHDGYGTWVFLSVSFGLLFLLNPTHSVFIAPNIIPVSGYETAFFAVQVLFGILCLNVASMQLAGAALLVMTAMLSLIYPFEVMIDYVFEFVGAGLALIYAGPKYSQFDEEIALMEHNEPKALFYLRVGIGLQLMTLAIHNKLMDPSLGMAFLQLENFNFMPYFGFTSFEDIHFVLSAGVAELAFGFMITFGLATRLVTAIVSVFFLLAAAFLGIEELLGHLPIVAFVVVIVAKGGGHFKNKVTD